LFFSLRDSLFDHGVTSTLGADTAKLASWGTFRQVWARRRGTNPRQNSPHRLMRPARGQMTLFGRAQLRQLPVQRLSSETAPVLGHVTSQIIKPAGGDLQGGLRASTEPHYARITTCAPRVQSLDAEQIQGTFRVRNADCTAFSPVPYVGR
jgi:hypothetical protein